MSMFANGLFSYCFILINFADALRVTNMSTPLVADIRESMELECQFDMGNEVLYAVKWYKDEQEFFRYMAHQEPSTILFPVAGVHINRTACDMTKCKVILWKLTRDHSGGAYTCEVSSEAPTFRQVAQTHAIIVAGKPRENPRIDGLSAAYDEGDTISAKCTSDLADPAPILSWYINGKSPPSHTVGEQISSIIDPSNGLTSRTVSLNTKAERKLARKGLLEIRCEASQPGVPLPPRATSTAIEVRPRKEPKPTDVVVLANEKLHWNGSVRAPKGLVPEVLVLFCVIPRIM